LSIYQQTAVKAIGCGVIKVVTRDKDADFESNVQTSYQALEAFK